MFKNGASKIEGEFFILPQKMRMHALCNET